MMAGGREGRGGVGCPADVERWWGRRRRIKVKGGGVKSVGNMKVELICLRIVIK